MLSVNGFRFYFTPLAGVLFAFPSRYLFAIGSCVVFRLGSWSTQIPTGFHVPRRTQVLHQQDRDVSDTGLSPALAELSRSFSYVVVFSRTCRVIPMQPYNPGKTGLACSAFARRYLRNLN